MNLTRRILKSFQPRCTMARDWPDRRRCGYAAIARNKFGGYVCPWHHYLPRDTQPDNYFKPGTLCSEIETDTLLGKLYLSIAFFFHTKYGVRLGAKR